MSEQNLPIVKTPVDMRSYARAVALAWRSMLGELPTKEQVGVLWAHYGIETGAGPWCWNYNIGNVKHIAGDGHNYIMLRGTWEMINGQRVVFQPPDPATWFRAFGSLDEAMRDHFALLHGRYVSAWPSVVAGDCAAFARALKARGYFTASAESYAAGMNAHFTRWMASGAFEAAIVELANDERPTEPALPANDITHPELYPEPGDEPPSAA